MKNESGTLRRTSARLRGRAHPKIYNTDEEDSCEVIPTKRRAISKQVMKVREQSKESEIVLSDGDDDGDNMSTNDGDEDCDCEPTQRQKSLNGNELFASGNEFAQEGNDNDSVDNDDDFQMPLSLAALFSMKRPTQSETERRVFRILESTQRELNADPSLRMPARRKPYQRLSKQLVKTCKPEYALLPRMNLAEFSERKCLEQSLPTRGFLLTSVPLDKTDRSFTLLKGDEDSDFVSGITPTWPVSEPLKCMESEHVCPMVEYMQKMIKESKQQTRQAWETVREILQKIREKEQLITQFKLQLHNERNAGGLSETVIRSLKEGRGMSSYATMHLSMRRNAQFVFQSILQNAFPNFTDQDMKQIFHDVMTPPYYPNPFTQKTIFASAISQKIGAIEENEEDCTPDKSEPERQQQIKTMSPLAVITPRLSASVTSTSASTRKTPQITAKTTTPQLLPAKRNVNKSKFTTLQQRGRRLMHPSLQYASAAKARMMSKVIVPPATLRPMMANKRPNQPPTLIRKFPSSTMASTLTSTYGCSNQSSSQAKSRENVVDLAIQKRVTTISKQVIPIRNPPPKDWPLARTRRLSTTQRLTLASHRLPTSKEALAQMADATELAQQENKRRLEAMFPVKTEPSEDV